jgi:Holliday junction resolvase RusA-like endonuclease
MTTSRTASLPAKRPSSLDTIEVDLTPIWITGIPIPPSSNKQYKPYKSRHTGKLSFKASPELIQYKRNLDLCFYRNPSQFLTNIKKLQSWLEHGIYFDVKATFFFERKTLVTLKGAPKQMDVSNKLKSLHDGLAKLLQVDDSLFFKISAEKRLTHANESETVVVEISPYFLEH